MEIESLFNARRVDELFQRQSDQEITDTLAGLGRSSDGIDRSRFSNTAIAIERLLGHPDYQSPNRSDPFAPFGRFRGRHIIGTGTRVLDGVYLGHRAREAIFVDSSSRVLRALCGSFIENRFSVIRTRFINGDIQLDITREGLVQTFQSGLPEALFQYTKKCLPYNEHKTSDVFRQAKIEPDAELSLDAYLIAQTGVCRHMVLFLVGMFELLSQIDLTHGSMSVCRCYIPNFFSHAWARFEQEGTGPIILDPAQNFFGTLENGGEMGKFVYDHELAKFLSAE
jgi:hypothetical protein